MEHSTFRQPLPEGLREHLSNSYAAASRTKPVPFEYRIGRTRRRAVGDRRPTWRSS